MLKRRLWSAIAADLVATFWRHLLVCCCSFRSSGGACARAASCWFGQSPYIRYRIGCSGACSQRKKPEQRLGLLLSPLHPRPGVLDPEQNLSFSLNAQGWDVDVEGTSGRNNFVPCDVQNRDNESSSSLTCWTWRRGWRGTCHESRAGNASPASITRAVYFGVSTAVGGGGIPKRCCAISSCSAMQ